MAVVIITRDRRDGLLGTLDRLVALPELGPGRVVVVDNGSADGTPAAVRDRHPGVVVLELGRNRGAAGRNDGVRAAGTPWVAFADDDSWWCPGALPRAASLLLADDRLAVVAARVVDGDGRPDPTCEAMAASPLPSRPGLPGPQVLGFLACGAVVRSDAFLAVGGFDERYGVGGEETPLAVELAAAGWSLAYVDDVVAVHQPSPVRDRARRDATVLRNELWLAWHRRRWAVATRRTAAAIRGSVAGGPARAGLVAALRGAPSVLASRRAVDRDLEERLLLLERGR